MTQAIVIEQYGGPEVLQLREIKLNSLGPREVRVRHTCIGVNFHDVYVRSGLYKTLQLPGTPGIEAVGVIEECGSDVTRWTQGDRVAYVTGIYGVYASARLIDESLLLPVPSGLSDSQVASALLRGLTVEMLVNRVHRLEPGSWALVQAAAGGVGQLLCQWISHLGGKAIGTVGDEEQSAAAFAAGCFATINYKESDVVQRVREITEDSGVAVAFDGVGKDTFTGSLNTLGLCGHLVNFGQASGPVPPFEISHLATRSTTLSRPIIFHYVRERKVREQMASNVFDGLSKGWLKVKDPQRFKLADAAESHRTIELRGATTPLVLIP